MAFSALVLALCLWLGAAVPARAAADTVTVTATAGRYVRLLIDMPDGETLRSHTVTDGHPAPGLLLRAEGEGLALVGTPTELGSWTMLVAAHTDGGDLELRIEQYIVSAEPSPTPVPTPTPEPEPTPTPEPPPEPTPAPTPEGLPTITKQPTGETVTAGGTAIFVARAADTESILWYLADPLGGEPMDVSEAGERFPGLLVYGRESETLALSGIPEDMNGWQAECRFTGFTGAVRVSDRATITVRRGALAAPVLTLLPEGTELYAGESVTLSARAVAPDGGEIRYQWYSTQEYNLATVRAIDGATESSYTPPNAEGTVWYCVGVKNVKGAEASSTAFSPLVSVTGIPEARLHVHDFSSPWHWNERTHWRECSCGERQDEAFHDFRWTVTKRATARADGERTGVCAVCGYETVETVPAGTQGRPTLLRVLMILALALVLVALGMGAVVVAGNARRRRRRARRPRSGSYNGTHVRR